MDNVWDAFMDYKTNPRPSNPEADTAAAHRAANILADTLGEYNRGLKKNKIPRAVRSKLLVELQQSLMPRK